MPKGNSEVAPPFSMCVIFITIFFKFALFSYYRQNVTLKLKHLAFDVSLSNYWCLFCLFVYLILFLANQICAVILCVTALCVTALSWYQSLSLFTENFSISILFAIKFFVWEINMDSVWIKIAQFSWKKPSKNYATI